MPVGRPQREISSELQQVFICLIATGDSDSTASRIIGVPRQSVHWFADRNPDFERQWKEAKTMRAAKLAVMIRNRMMQEIQSGKNPTYWVRLAIRNYAVGLKDPDIEMHRDVIHEKA